MPFSDQCLRCKFYLSEATCHAFPGGIPEVIFIDGLNHAKPYPEDGGIRFGEGELTEADEKLSVKVNDERLEQS